MNRNSVHIVLDEFHKVANAADAQLVGLHRHAAGKDQPAAFFRCGCIMNALVRNGVPYVLAGSIRDDGPLPGVYGNAYEAQDAMRDHIRSATTVICMATMLHTIATGNMTPSYRVLADGTIRPVYFYCVDIAEFAVNKLVDRGSLASRGIVTNVQDFIANIAKGLGLLG